MFMAYPFLLSEPVATLLAHITCHENELPQGAPTSPLISNVICRRLDSQLTQVARRERCYYTRYADDLVFSTDRRSFPSALAEHRGSASPVLGQEIHDIIVSNGFAVNFHKLSLSPRSQRLRVAGLVVNERLNVPREYVRSLRNLLYIWKRYGEADAAASFSRHDLKYRPPGKDSPEFKLIVRGRVQYVGGIRGWDDPVYVRLAEQLRDLDPTFVPTLRAAGSAGTRIRVLTEGKTDAMIFEKALKVFQSQGDFAALSLTFEGVEVDDAPGGARGGGAPALLGVCTASLRSSPAVPTICVFDGDLSGREGKAAGEDGKKRYGPRCMAIRIVAPPWRDASRPYCLEMLFDDTTLLKKDEGGRRIYLRSEFDPDTSMHLKEETYARNPNQGELIPEMVVDPRTRTNVALSKAGFAEAVANEWPPYTNANFEGFRDTFRRIEEAAVLLGTSAQ
jgi:RNA-directed DNA polymerase